MTRHLLKLLWNRKRANALLIVEVFISFLVAFVVLTGATFLIDNYQRPLGFKKENVWNIAIDTKSLGSSPRSVTQQSSGSDVVPGRPVISSLPSENLTRLNTILRELKANPNVEAVAAAEFAPYEGASSTGIWQMNGREISLEFNDVTDEFREVLGLELVHGRWFRPEDDALGWTPVVLDLDASRAVYGTENAVGKRFDPQSTRKLFVVGVVRDFRKSGEFSPVGNYVIRRQNLTDSESPTPRNIIMRLRPGTTTAFEEQLSKRLKTLAPEWSFQIRSLARMRKTAFQVWLTPLFVMGTVSLFLMLMVSLGLTGVLWQNVTRRTREIGLRRALGGTAASVSRLVMTEIALLTTVALLLGTLVIAQLPLLGITAWVRVGVLVGGLVAAALTIYLITSLAALYPSRFASRIDPSEALRYE